MSVHRIRSGSMWAHMCIIVLLNSLKVGVTRSLRTRKMLKVDLCANGAGAYAPYAPPLPTGLCTMFRSTKRSRPTNPATEISVQSSHRGRGTCCASLADVGPPYSFSIIYACALLLPLAPRPREYSVVRI